MKIPDKIQIMDCEITVEYDKKLSFEAGCCGLAAYRENKIFLQPSTEDFPRPDCDIEKTFFHEMTHWILFKMDETDLRNNEKFVDVFAACLRQALMSGKII